jgi:hypothetical protein
MHREKALDPQLLQGHILGVPRVAIVVKSSSETSPLRKIIGNTGSAAGPAAGVFSSGRTSS